MEKLAEFKGQNGILIVYNDYLVISRKSFKGFISQGGYGGERKYFYNDISSIDYKKPTIMANGYFKIIVQGTVETSAKVGLFSSSRDSMKDPNTIILRAFSKKVGEETDRINDLIMQKILNAKKEKTVITTSTSKMDELKKLAELKEAGILTEDEFKKEKEKLLNS